MIACHYLLFVLIYSHKQEFQLFFIFVYPDFLILKIVSIFHEKTEMYEACYYNGRVKIE